ncbi:cupin domain-containing protein [Aromatoleum toluvorans]|uniref:Cupin domain-containing protein n=1 Tax=Aromatoleum toluvorans TaxID=92002 RepID=A0ABX1Q1A8_9RHOO|nr:pirin-like bicupin family protein [Aromatoleum toluvorans]NMG45481.1 cupin domain-containing protein [Aromatoleum toluvorans]
MSPQFRKIDASTLHYLPASDRHPADTYFHFSFADYYNPDNIQFGALRVINDDDVKPHGGFDRHPHRDMEIVSYVVGGKLTHWDSATNVEATIGRGDVQIVTAGTGVWHSELNRHDEWCRFLQIWILPPAANLPVRYAQRRFEPQDRLNRLLHIVGNTENRDEVPLYLNQDVNLYVSELQDPEARVSFTVQAGRQAYVNNIEGHVAVKGVTELAERDALEVVGPAELEFSLAGEHAHFIIIEMAESPDR